MKKITATIACFAIIGSLFIPVSAEESDYSQYVGSWGFVDDYSGDVSLNITAVNGHKMDFDFYYAMFEAYVKGADIDGDKVYGNFYTDDSQSGTIVLELGGNAVNVIYSELGVYCTLNKINDGVNKTDAEVGDEMGGEVNVLLDGYGIAFDQKPVIINDRTMVPLRAIFETMGYTVGWDGDTRTATAVRGNDRIVTQIGNNTIEYTLDGKTASYVCDVPPQILSDRTLVPLRAIGECGGCAVGWDGDSKTASLTSASGSLSLLYNWDMSRYVSGIEASADMDGDGVQESISISPLDDFDITTTIKVGNSEYSFANYSMEAIYIMDMIPGDNAKEIVLFNSSDDVCLYLYILRYENGSIKPLSWGTIQGEPCYGYDLGMFSMPRIMPNGDSTFTAYETTHSAGQWALKKKFSINANGNLSVYEEPVYTVVDTNMLKGFEDDDRDNDGYYRVNKSVSGRGTDLNEGDLIKPLYDDDYSKITIQKSNGEQGEFYLNEYNDYEIASILGAVQAWHERVEYDQ